MNIYLRRPLRVNNGSTLFIMGFVVSYLGGVKSVLNLNKSVRVSGYESRFDFQIGIVQILEKNYYVLY